MDRPRTPPLALILVALAIVGWAYWATLAEVVERWSNDPQYSHGFLVPLFSIYLLWMRRDHLRASDIGARWWGLAIVALAALLRLVSHFLYQPWLDTGSFLVCLMGLAAVAGGRRALIWSAPAILFLVFMLPLPYRAQMMLGGSLQRGATIASTYALQTLGVPAVAEGNVILLTNTRLGVVEACNGLSMLITFFRAGNSGGHPGAARLARETDHLPERSADRGPGQRGPDHRHGSFVRGVPGRTGQSCFPRLGGVVDDAVGTRHALFRTVRPWTVGGPCRRGSAPVCKGRGPCGWVMDSPNAERK